MNDTSKSKIDTSGIETLLSGIVESLNKAVAGLEAPGELARSKWPKIRRTDTAKVGKQFNSELTKVAKAHRSSIDSRRTELDKVLKERAKRLKAAANPKAPTVRTKKGGFVVTGRIVDEQEGLGLPNVVVKAFDMDRKYDDLLGETRTDANGYYTIEYSAKTFKDVFDEQPETYIEVLNSDGENIYTSARSFVHKAGEKETINASVPTAGMESNIALARQRKIGIEMQRKETEIRAVELAVRDLRVPPR